MKRLVLACALAAACLASASPAAAAGWCGSGETSADRPALVTGAQVRVVYALPSDGPDNFATVANEAADDIASIDTWWRGQDSTRTIRFDLADFSGCAGLDLGVVRLDQTAAAIHAAADDAFRQVATALSRQEAFGRQGERYLVLYDGPTQDADVCGTGGEAGNLGYAVIWLQACTDVPRDAVAAHELTHTFGAVAAGAPHSCPAPNIGHVCDSNLDLMYPYTTGGPLLSTVLDVGRDDYYGTGVANDIRAVPWLRHLDVPLVPLAVATAGAGRIASAAPGVDCTAACTTQWESGTRTTLEATPAAGSRFVRWQGACSGKGSCLVAFDAPTSVTAVFGPATVPLHITVAGRGSVGGDVLCFHTCTKSIAGGTSLTLRARPAKGWRFAGWGGACRGTRGCAPRTDGPVAVRATFRKR